MKNKQTATEILDALRENIADSINALAESDVAGDVVFSGFAVLGVGPAGAQILMQRFWNARVQARGPEPPEPPLKVSEPRANLAMPESAPAGMYGREVWKYGKI